MPQMNSSPLDEIRAQKGNAACTNLFLSTFQKSQEQALALLDAEQLTFPCLFTLLPHMQTLDLADRLPPTVATAMAVARQIIGDSSQRDHLAQKSEPVHSALRWMLQTGSGDSEPDHRYHKVLDIAVSVLIHTYGDRDILPAVADMIFARRNRGHNVHDLIWAFFRSKEPQALQLVAEKLPGADPGEAEFIRDLLGIADLQSLPPHLQYQVYIKALKASAPHLPFSEENKQYMSRPVVCRLKITSQNDGWRS